MPTTHSTSMRKILMLGASYGSLLGVKLAMTGRDVSFVCLPPEAELINRDGVRVRLPVKGEDRLVEAHSQALPGKIDACGPAEVDPTAFDLVGLAMQEPQYRSPGVRELMARIAGSGRPCMSIMNMPPLPYLARIPDLDVAALRDCYADATVWDPFDPSLMTLCSPDPQAFRPPEEPANVLQVGLPTNFKAARFQSDAHTAGLRAIERDILEARLLVDGRSLETPVKLRVSDSIFVPMAKWAMLLTGNYRCIQPDGARSIRDAVYADLAQSRRVYDWVSALCRTLGAAAEDLVPFEKYAKAAEGLVKPSSAARALFAGAPNIERVDRLVRRVGAQHGVALDEIDRIVDLVDAKLEQNRKAKD